MSFYEVTRDACDWLVVHLQEVGLQRRIWRPTVKFILGGGYMGSIWIALIFSIILTISSSKKPTLKSFILTMVLLIAMETVSDWADMYTTKLLTTKNIQPMQTLRLLSSATALIYMEITLWKTAVVVYTN